MVCNAFYLTFRQGTPNEVWFRCQGPDLKEMYDLPLMAQVELSSAETCPAAAMAEIELSELLDLY